MDQNLHYMMWLKSKQLMNSHFHSSLNSLTATSSWEEQAFAEDAAGPLGGFVWPPRSYSCTFCRREFRSAQALGGHMNVHRRDRARLKQSHFRDQTPPSPPEIQHSPQNDFSSSLFYRDISPAVETNLSVGRSSYSEEMVSKSKRLKTSESIPPLYHKICSSDRFPFQYEMLRMKTARANSINEDIDLELRLGDPPAVK